MWALANSRTVAHAASRSSSAWAYPRRARRITKPARLIAPLLGSSILDHMIEYSGPFPPSGGTQVITW